MANNNPQDEEEEVWEALPMDDDPFVPQPDEQQEQAIVPASQQHRNGNRSSFSAAAGRASSNNHESNNNSLQTIQQKLETRIALQKNLVNHPIDFFWKRFLVNMLRELWSLEVRIRLGLVLLVAGVITRMFVWSFWYMLYPKTALLSVIFLASFIYIDPFQVQSQIKTVGDMFVSTERLAHTLERLDTQQLRKLSGLLFLFPTFLEMRTLSFLSQIKAETGWTMYNLSLGACILVAMLYLVRVKGMQPREATYQGMLILYGSALVVSIFTMNVRRMPFLAAPFMTATGTLLLTYNNDDLEWISRIVRYSLRVTLRDVLASVGTRVNQDEMLQLAILRWISDFWASNHASTPASTNGNNNGGQSAHQENSSNADAHSTSPMPSGGQHGLDGATSPPEPTSSQGAAATSAPQAPTRHDVQWDELLPMLNVEIDHMEAEVEELQSNENDGAPQGHTQHQGAHDPSSNSHHGFDDLKSMLLSLNIDDRAEPAVAAYKRAVESFPPQKRTAFLISLLRRTPASLTILFHIVFGGTVSLLSSFIILSPFAVMEYYRIMRWIARCQQMPNLASGAVSQEQSTDKLIPTELVSVDPMTILLCGDSHPSSRAPTLLLVWHNIVSSVSALQVGLTAARCAETTAVAAQFAGNVISLAQFGFEVSQHGVLHGIGIVLKEAISVGGDFSNLDSMDDDAARYTKAAVGALQSGQRVARNVQRLGEDEHVGVVVKPVMMALDFLSGFLGKKQGGAPETGSTVVIEELSTAEADSSKQNIVIESVDTGHREKEQEHSISNEGTATNCRGKEQSESLVDSSVVGISESDTQNSPQALVDIQEEVGLTDQTKAPYEDLSCVMEMVAQAYEQNLIEETEKANFFMKLSMLREEELSSSDVLMSMKRTLEVILKNGNGITVEGTSQGVQFEVLDNSSVSGDNEGVTREVKWETLENTRNEDDLDNLRLGGEEEDISHASAVEGVAEESNNEALFRFGAAAVGVVAGGLLLSMTQRNESGRDQDGSSDFHRSSEQAEGQERDQHEPPVVIEELEEDGEDEWVSFPQ